MRSLLLTCLLAVGCLAQKPHPCKSPPLLSGNMVVSTQNEAMWGVIKYVYDGLGQRIRFQETGVSQNKTFTVDALLLYRESFMYVIDQRTRNCTKRPLRDTFHPLEVPSDAHLLGQAVIGSSSGMGEGLLVNTWTGEQPGAGRYMSTFTEFGCIPVTTAYQTPAYGWMQYAFYNNVKGIPDPAMLNPPDFCKEARLETKPADFLSLFF